MGPATQEQNNDAEKELLRLISQQINSTRRGGQAQLKKIKAMKKATGSFKPLSEEQVKTLTTTVKETLGSSQAQRFTAYDLWNIQRRGRTMMQRRQFV